jgi:hypothetical protein
MAANENAAVIMMICFMAGFLSLLRIETGNNRHDIHGGMAGYAD